MGKKLLLLPRFWQRKHDSFLCAWQHLVRRAGNGVVALECMMHHCLCCLSMTLVCLCVTEVRVNDSCRKAL